MAWWNTQLVFQDDTLIAEGADPALFVEPDLEVVVQGGKPDNGTAVYTYVIVSGYALYGQLRGYYALGVSHWYVDRKSGRVYMTEAGQQHNESITSLSVGQRAVIREFLVNFNKEAWETSTRSFRRQLEA